MPSHTGRAAPAEEVTGSMAQSSTAQALPSATRLRHSPNLDRPISMARCWLSPQLVELSHMVLGTFSCGLGGCGSGLSSSPQQALKQLPTKTHRYILGQAAHVLMPNSLTGMLGSALLRIVRGAAQRAAGGPHRELYPIPKPSRALEAAALREAWAPTVATLHQCPGLLAQGLFCPVVHRNS